MFICMNEKDEKRPRGYHHNNISELNNVESKSFFSVFKDNLKLFKGEPLRKK